MRKDKLDVRRDVREAFSYFKRSKLAIASVVCIFALSAVIGLVFAEYLMFLDKLLEGLLSKAESYTGVRLFFFIFFHNAQSALSGLLFGILLGIPPVLIALFNGLILGYVVNKVGSAVGFYELWRLLPHGIFELPAVFIALGLGMRLGIAVIRPGKEGFFQQLRASIVLFMILILPLLLVAAAIESILITYSS